MADDYLRRTAITCPILTDEQKQLLDATINEWQDACNVSSQIGWEHGETRKTYLQDLAYDGFTLVAGEPDTARRWTEAPG